MLSVRLCGVLLNRWSTNSMSLIFGYPLRLLRRSHKNAEPSTRYFYGNIFWNCSPWPIHFRAPFSGPHSHLKWFISCSRFLNSPFFPGIKLPLESMIFAGLEMVAQILQSVWYNHSPARQKNQRWIDMCFYFVRYSHAFVQDLLLYLPDNSELFFGIPSLVDAYHRQINNFILRLNATERFSHQSQTTVTQLVYYSNYNVYGDFTIIPNGGYG